MKPQSANCRRAAMDSTETWHKTDFSEPDLRPYRGKGTKTLQRGKLMVSQEESKLTLACRCQDLHSRKTLQTKRRAARSLASSKHRKTLLGRDHRAPHKRSCKVRPVQRATNEIEARISLQIQRDEKAGRDRLKQERMRKLHLLGESQTVDCRMRKQFVTAQQLARESIRAETGM